MEGGDGCTLLWMYLMPQTVHLKIVKNDKVYITYILPQ